MGFSRCLLTFSLEYTLSCGGGNSTEASSTIRVPMYSSQMKHAQLVCRPPPASPQQVFISKGPGLGDDFSHITSKADWVQSYPELQKTFSNCFVNGNRVGGGVDKAVC